jgi:dUTPase
MVELPQNTVGWLTGRSSTVLSFNLLTHEGKIDSGYRGVIHAMLSALDRPATISEGERIVQLVVLPILPPQGLLRWQTVDALGSSERGTRGLGSTGRA